MKFQKKPVEVEAFCWTGGPDQAEDPEWIVEAIKRHDIYFPKSGTPDVKMCIRTLEGTMTADIGDYIIQGINGEIYPCKPDIFIKTYEPVDLT